ncbi:hypothetical protein [pigeon parvovirus 1]|uniref:Uncharacterized protein n=1 Tax=pigeon parvovirus 1 TaxID=2848031 RepID=U3R5V6_9VIRU|nr:hypothetical protein QKL04_gp3 [Pigeon parvovirus A]AGW95847.1 hypothetical protein [pigeon parvovirus 1]
MLWTLLGLTVVFSLIAYLYEGLMEENGGERRRQLGGKCLVKYVIVLILLIEPSRGYIMDPIIRDKEKCIMQWKETLGCAGGNHLEERCDKFAYKTEDYIWPPNSTKYCNHKRDWVVLGEAYCVRSLYGNEIGQCLGEKPRKVDLYLECCPVTGLL